MAINDCKVIVRRVCSLAWLALAAACGGGGAGSGAPPAAEAPRPPLATAARDDNPATPRLAQSPDDYLPRVDSQWTFWRLDRDGQRVGRAQQALQVLANDQLRFTLSGDVQTPGVTELRRTADGWVQHRLPDGPWPAAVAQAIGELLRLPSPFHALGSTRVQARSGSYGSDLDGDGVHESFEFEFRQTMVGEEAVPGPRGPLTTLHIRDEFAFTVIPSRRDGATQRVTTRHDHRLSRGLGFVGSHVSAWDGADREQYPPYTLALDTVHIAGVDSLPDSTLRDVRRIALVHRSLIYDAPNRRYVASVPSSAGADGNRLVLIDADSGAMTWSPVIGTDPGALALAADGASLYVALDGSAEVLRLALPSWQVLGRVAMPEDTTFGGPLRANALAASPLQPGVVAVALAGNTGLWGRAGLLLLRDMVAMPLRTPAFKGPDIIVFNTDGSRLLGLANEGRSPPVLHSIEVRADGLALGPQPVDAVALSYLGLRHIDRIGPRVVVGDMVFSTDDLAPWGRVDGAAECRATPGGQLVCLNSLGGPLLAISVARADPVTIQAQLDRPETDLDQRLVLVPGPPGQVAVRAGIRQGSFPLPEQRDGDAVLIVRHPALP